MSRSLGEYVIGRGLRPGFLHSRPHLHWSLVLWSYCFTAGDEAMPEKLANEARQPRPGVAALIVLRRRRHEHSISIHGHGYLPHRGTGPDSFAVLCLGHIP